MLYVSLEFNFTIRSEWISQTISRSRMAVISSLRGGRAEGWEMHETDCFLEDIRLVISPTYIRRLPGWHTGSISHSSMIEFAILLIVQYHYILRLSYFQIVNPKVKDTYINHPFDIPGKKWSIDLAVLRNPGYYDTQWSCTYCGLWNIARPTIFGVLSMYL